MNPRKDAGKARPCGSASPATFLAYGEWRSADRGGFTQVFAFHGHSAASVTNEFHGRQFAFTHMGVVDFRGAAKRTVLFIATRTAEMTGFFGHRATIFTGMDHDMPPLVVAVYPSES
jgi:hypothetical protein